METIEGAIIERLKADAAVAAIIGSTPIQPATDPSPRLPPRLYYQTITNTRGMSNDGPNTLRQASMMLYASAVNMLTAKQLAKAANDSLDGFRGTLSGIRVGCIRVEGPTDETPELPPGQTKAAQRVRMEITVDYYAT